jgi:hypothetical protein
MHIISNINDPKKNNKKSTWKNDNIHAYLIGLKFIDSVGAFKPFARLEQ